MSFSSRRISYGYFRKAFIFTLIGGVFLLFFYMYYENYEAALDYIRAQKKLHPRLFKNTSEILQPKECSINQSQNISLIFISSAPQNQLRRQIIRSNWAQKKIMTHLHFRVIFIIEETNDSETTQLNLESEMFGDIVRTHSIDSYSHLIYKIMIGFQWALKYCPTADFIIKVNDDVFVNPFTLRELLNELHNLSFIANSNLPQQVFDQNLPEQSNSLKHVALKINHNSVFESLFLRRHNPVRDLKFVFPPKPMPNSHPTYNSQSDTKPNDIVENFSDIKDWNKTIFCFVWRNSRASRHAKNSEHPPYCSDVAYILLKQTASLLIDNHLKTNPSNILVAEGIYVTGILAAETNINHVQIGSHYAFNTKNIEATVKSDIIFTYLGKDMEAITNYIWNRIEEQIKIRIKL